MVRPAVFPAPAAVAATGVVQQGALRSMFLFKSGLDAAKCIATGTLIAILIDLSRLPTYAASFADDTLSFSGRPGALIAVGTPCAFAVAWLGARYMKKATIGAVRVLAVTLMLLIGVALITGVLGS